MDVLATSLHLALRLGRENSQTRRRLSMILGTSDRELRRAVTELRNHGVLVCSTQTKPGGYFIAASLDELEATAAHLTSRAISGFVTVRAMRKAAAVEFGDSALRLFDLEEIA